MIRLLQQVLRLTKHSASQSTSVEENYADYKLLYEDLHTRVEFERKSTKPQPKNWTGINHRRRNYPHDSATATTVIPTDQGSHVLPFISSIKYALEYDRGGESSRKYSTSVTKTMAADYGHIKWIEDLVPNSMWSD
ncbi:hypothetical protein Tco_0634622 [Tanacetum coccineum]